MLYAGPLLARLIFLDASWISDAFLVFDSAVAERTITRNKLVLMGRREDEPPNAIPNTFVEAREFFRGTCLRRTVLLYMAERAIARPLAICRAGIANSHCNAETPRRNPRGGKRSRRGGATVAPG